MPDDAQFSKNDAARIAAAVRRVEAMPPEKRYPRARARSQAGGGSLPLLCKVLTFYTRGVMADLAIVVPLKPDVDPAGRIGENLNWDNPVNFDTAYEICVFPGIGSGLQKGMMVLCQRASNCRWWIATQIVNWTGPVPLEGVADGEYMYEEPTDGGDCDIADPAPSECWVDGPPDSVGDPPSVPSPCETNPYG